MVVVDVWIFWILQWMFSSLHYPYFARWVSGWEIRGTIQLWPWKTSSFTSKVKLQLFIKFSQRKDALITTTLYFNLQFIYNGQLFCAMWIQIKHLYFDWLYYWPLWIVSFYKKLESNSEILMKEKFNIAFIDKQQLCNEMMESHLLAGTKFGLSS